MTHSPNRTTLSARTTTMKDAATFETTLKKLLRQLCAEFIFHPDDLEISTKRFKTIIGIQWRGHRADTSRMIGERGETFRALAEYLKLVGQQHGYDVELERIQEATKGEPERYPPFKANPDWPRERIMALLEAAVTAASRNGQVEVTSGDVGSDRTGIEVAISTKETAHTEGKIRETLRHLFKVIGNANGRVLLVDVTRTLDPDPEQPQSAAGRFAKVR